MKYTPQTYTILEILFHNWQWVRKLSKSYWVNRIEEGYQWVKFDRQEMIDNGFCFENNPDYLVEDYTVNKIGRAHV